MATRCMPVKDPVKLVYIGPVRANAIQGPVSGNGYSANPGEREVERSDVAALLKTGQWKRPPRKTKNLKTED